MSSTLEVRNVSGEALDVRGLLGRIVAADEVVIVYGAISARLVDAVTVLLADGREVAFPSSTWEVTGSDTAAAVLARVGGDPTLAAGELAAEMAGENRKGLVADLTRIVDGTDAQTQVLEGMTPSEVVSGAVAAGATFAPGAADEGNPLGLYAPDEAPTDPGTEPPAEVGQPAPDSTDPAAAGTQNGK